MYRNLGSVRLARDRRPLFLPAPILLTQYSVFSTITVVIEVLRHRTHYHYSARRTAGAMSACVCSPGPNELGKLHTFRPAGLPAKLVLYVVILRDRRACPRRREGNIRCEGP